MPLSGSTSAAASASSAASKANHTIIQEKISDTVQETLDDFLSSWKGATPIVPASVKSDAKRAIASARHEANPGRSCLAMQAGKAAYRAANTEVSERTEQQSGRSRQFLASTIDKIKEARSEQDRSKQDRGKQDQSKEDHIPWVSHIMNKLSLTEHSRDWSKVKPNSQFSVKAVTRYEPQEGPMESSVPHKIHMLLWAELTNPDVSLLAAEERAIHIADDYSRPMTKK